MNHAVPVRAPASAPTDVTEHLIATADRTDRRLDGAMQDLLRLIRRELRMEVAFIAEFVDGRRVFRAVDADAGIDAVVPGDSHPLEESLCQRLVDGRIPRLIPDMNAVRTTQLLPDASASLAAHAGVPVRLSDGTVYGTLCCFSFSPHESLGAVQLQRLEMSAQLAANLLDESEGRGRQQP